MNVKKILSTLLAATMVCTLAACGGVSETSSTPASSSTQASSAPTGEASAPATQKLSSGDVAIDFWHHMEGANATALEATVTEFNNTVGKQYGIVATPSFQGTNTAEKLKTLAQANDWGNFPDVCQIASAAMPTVAGYDLLVKPDAMYGAGQNIIVPKADILPNALRTFAYKGEQIGLPFSNSAILLFYNKDMFAKAGIAAPPTTIDEMVDAINKLTVKDGKEVVTHGLEAQVKRYQLFNFLGSMGDCNFLGDQEGGRAGMMTRFTFGDDGTLMKYLDKWEKVIATGGYKATEDNINEEFAMQLTGMAIMSSARIAKVKELSDGSFNWGTAQLPKVEASDKGGIAVGGSGVVVFDKKDDLRKEAAWIFQQYLAGEDAQFTFCTGSGYIPVNKNLYNSERMKTFLSENEAMSAAAVAMQSANANVQEPFDLVTGEINNIIDTEMVAFAKGQSKQVTHDNIVKKCNDKVAEYVSVNS